eukprot:1765958-Pyramimonas_sp.AAC.1
MVTSQQTQYHQPSTTTIGTRTTTSAKHGTHTPRLLLRLVLAFANIGMSAVTTTTIATTAATIIQVSITAILSGQDVMEAVV